MGLKKCYRSAKYGLIILDRRYGRPLEKVVSFESWSKPAKTGLAAAVAVGYVGSKGLSTLGWYEVARLSNELWKYSQGNPSNFGLANIEKIGIYLGGSLLFSIVETGGCYIGGKYFWKKYKHYRQSKLLSKNQNVLHE